MRTRKKKNIKTTVDKKTVFRRSKEWKEFRIKIRKQQKKDPITGSPLTKNFNLHHLDENPEHYSDISDESHFIGLNSTSHSVIHYIWGDGNRRYDWKKRIQRIVEICSLMDEINNKEVENE